MLDQIQDAQVTVVVVAAALAAYTAHACSLSYTVDTLATLPVHLAIATPHAHPFEGQTPPGF